MTARDLRGESLCPPHSVPLSRSVCLFLYPENLGKCEALPQGGLAVASSSPSLAATGISVLSSFTHPADSLPGPSLIFFKVVLGADWYDMGAWGVGGGWWEGEARTEPKAGSA